jgi:hypothetical protein
MFHRGDYSKAMFAFWYILLFGFIKFRNAFFADPEYLQKTHIRLPALSGTHVMPLHVVLHPSHTLAAIPPPSRSVSRGMVPALWGYRALTQGAIRTPTWANAIAMVLLGALPTKVAVACVMCGLIFF